MSYNYSPLFGVDEYNPLNVSIATPYGGGAFESNDNLLITLWGVTQGDYLPTDGELIKPFVFTTEGAEEVGDLAAAGVSNGEKFFGQFFDSRYSARFSLSFDGEGAPEKLLGVLRPPQDMKNQLALAFAPSSGGGLRGQARGSLLSANIWHFSATGADYAVLPETAAFGSALPFDGLNLLKTNGADGEFPLFYDFSAQPREVLTALITGDYYVPVVFSRTESSSHLFDIAYRHSASRR